MEEFDAVKSNESYDFVPTVPKLLSLLVQFTFDDHRIFLIYLSVHTCQA
jgi:hypothetical protein